MLHRPPSHDERRRLQQRARQKRYQQRQEQGHITFNFTTTPEETAKLHRLHYLATCDLEDRARIVAALHTLIANIRED